MFREAQPRTTQELGPREPPACCPAFCLQHSLCVCVCVCGRWLGGVASVCTYISAINEIRAIMPIPRELQKREEKRVSERVSETEM